METLSIVVPCLNEQEAIPLFYSAVLKETAGMDVAFEFWFVDDGSTDGTLDALKRLREQDPRVKYISFSRNFGKESAMYAGMEASVGEYVVIMDVDLQDPPSLLPQMRRNRVMNFAADAVFRKPRLERVSMRAVDDELVPCACHARAHLGQSEKSGIEPLLIAPRNLTALLIQLLQKSQLDMQ